MRAELGCSKLRRGGRPLFAPEPQLVQFDSVERLGANDGIVRAGRHENPPLGLPAENLERARLGVEQPCVAHAGATRKE